MRTPLAELDTMVVRTNLLASDMDQVAGGDVMLTDWCRPSSLCHGRSRFEFAVGTETCCYYVHVEPTVAINRANCAR